jgi:AraC-like DNA-binding protein
MLHFSTEDLPPEQRFEQWREMRARNLFGVTIELPRERRGAFHGLFRARTIGTAVASEMRASAYDVSRTRSDIARIAGNSLCIALQVRGPGALDIGLDRIEAVNEGDMTIGHSDQPYAGRPRSDRDFNFKLLRIPIDDTLTLGTSIDDLPSAKPAQDDAIMLPFRALFGTLTADQTDAADPGNGIAHISRLALALRHRLPSRTPEVRAAVRAGLRCAALDIMDRHSRRPELAPASVGRMLGISVRQLHVVFEEAGTSFGRTLSRKRAREAHRMLLGRPALSVTEIAFACGFDSLATFYRAFRGLYGMAPGEARAFGLEAARASPARRT